MDYDTARYVALRLQRMGYNVARMCVGANGSWELWISPTTKHQPFTNPAPWYLYRHGSLVGV